MEQTKIQELESRVEKLKWGMAFIAVLYLFTLASVGYVFHLILQIISH